jgi:hypothetical protein
MSHRDAAGVSWLAFILLFVFVFVSIFFFFIVAIIVVAVIVIIIIVTIRISSRITNNDGQCGLMERHAS